MKEKINSYMWKKVDKTMVPLMEMTEEELQKALDQCSDMIWNTSTFSPGREKIKINVYNAINDCNAELLLRHILWERDDFPFTRAIDVINYIQTFPDLDVTDTVSAIFSNLRIEFHTVKIKDLLRACTQTAEQINRHMISKSFIIKQGIWLTESEKFDLTERDSNGEVRNIKDVIKERLFLSPDEFIRISPNGFTYKEFRAIIQLDDLTKVSDIPSDILRSLRDKIFVRLVCHINEEIMSWKKLIAEIKEVAAYRKIQLTDKNYD